MTGRTVLRQPHPERNATPLPVRPERSRRAQCGRRWRAALLLAPLLLAACGQRSDDPGLGGLSHSEASQLNDAAVILDANSVSADAINTNAREPSQ
jgi:hypothetical protein